MFRKKGNFGTNDKKNNDQNVILTLDELKRILANMNDVEIIEHEINKDLTFTLVYIRTLIDQERVNEAIIQPLNKCTDGTFEQCIAAWNITNIETLGEAKKKLTSGSILLFDPRSEVWSAVPFQNNTGRSIESSETETILYGPKDSFSEQLDQNITLIRRRLPLTELKTETFSVGNLSKTTVVMMYIEGLTNPEFISIARKKLSDIDFDIFLDSSQVAAFLEDHYHSVFPQFQQTDRPDVCAYGLSMGKITFLVGNTPFALNAPITFFHLFQSPEDYINRWPVASFLRLLRYISYILSLTLVPIYVALTTYHYQMIPLQVLFVILESRTKLPFTPFWESVLMLTTLEIIKEASLRMPTKAGQVLGVIGGIVIGQASVEAGFASKILIVLVGFTAIASFLVPNYLVTKSNTLLQYGFLILSSFLGFFGIALGLVILFAHLNSLTSLKQPYLSPVSPLSFKDWLDVFIRGPYHWEKTRPAYLKPLNKWRYSQRRR
jgi:hypothetical protein